MILKLYVLDIYSFLLELHIVNFFVIKGDQISFYSCVSLTHAHEFFRAAYRYTQLGAWYLSNTRCRRVSSEARAEIPSHSQTHDCVLDSAAALHHCGAGGEIFFNVSCMNPCVRDVPPSSVHAQPLHAHGRFFLTPHMQVVNSSRKKSEIIPDVCSSVLEQI